MKQLYTSLLTGAALLVAGAVGAQSAGTNKLDPNGALMLRQGGSSNTAHVSGSDVMRGTAPVNDACSSVSPQSLAVGGSLTFSGDNTGATIAGDYEAGSQLETAGYPSVWHAITTTACTNLTLSYCGSAAGFTGNFWIVISNACPAGDASLVFYSSYDTLTCADGQVTIRYEGIPAGTYYVPVLTDEANGVVGAYTIGVAAGACTSAPANDDCAGAIPVTVGSWCNFTNYGSTGATESLPALSCNGFTGSANDDVWFSFVATNANMTIGVQGAEDGDGDATTGYDAVVELFEGACPGTSINCADATLNSEAEEIQASGLTVGNTYYVRTYHYYTAAPSLASFGICVVEGAGINIGIEENASATDWSIYPNPGTGVFNIQYNGANTTVSIEVIDITGRVVYTQQTSMAAGTNHSIDLSGVAAGNYNVRLTTNGVRTEQRLAVK